MGCDLVGWVWMDLQVGWCIEHLTMQIMWIWNWHVVQGTLHHRPGDRHQPHHYLVRGQHHRLIRPWGQRHQLVRGQRHHLVRGQAQRCRDSWQQPHFQMNWLVCIFYLIYLFSILVLGTGSTSSGCSGLRHLSSSERKPQPSTSSYLPPVDH